MKGVSVIICCYNSAQRISDTLKYLFNQQGADSIPWEVVIVNNASSDSTSEIAKAAWVTNGGDTNFKIVDQPIPGLSSARQKGIEVSNYDFLIFCDDDNHLEPNYVAAAFNLMHENPEVGIAGGWVKPKLPFYPGKWIEPNYPALAIGKQSNTASCVDWVFGAGMVFRKKIFDDLRSKKIELLLSDRKGKSQSSGGDAEMCQLARFIGYKIYYSPTLILYHQIEGKRLTKKSFIKSNLQNFHATVHLYIMESLIRDKDKTLRQLLSSFINERAIRILKAIPRVIVGRNYFFYFLEIYVGSFLLSWILLHRTEVKKTFSSIRQNLYNDNAR